MTPDDFLSRLSAGLDRDEQLARAADKTRWLPEDKGITFEVDDMESDYSGRLSADTKANMNHIANFNPDRALRQVEAIRKVIERYEFVTSHGPAVDNTRAMDMTTGATAALRDVLESLASIYADPAETGGES